MTGRGLKTHIAFFFTALAALMMLTGSVLPHYHHGGCVCIDLSHSHSRGILAVGVVCHQHGGATHTDAETQCVLNVNYYCPKKENPMSVVLAHTLCDRDVDPGIFLPEETGFEGLSAAETAVTPPVFHGMSPLDFFGRASAWRAPPFLLA